MNTEKKIISPFRLERKTKILATLGPSSSTEEAIRELVHAGVNVFRLNFSHGTYEEQQSRFERIRHIEKEIGRPIGILVDLQGPKLRVSTFTQGSVTLNKGDTFKLFLNTVEGNQQGVTLHHKEIFDVASIGQNLLVDDGKVRLKVTATSEDIITTEVMVGGTVSDRKGVNVPDTQLPISALTLKDREDLNFALELGVDWIALSFVQRPEDILEAQALINGKAAIMAKLEKPSALDNLDAIIDVSDAIMVARGDLGVELPPERVPSIQKRIVASSRAKGRPVVVATQMLESMISSPVPTRAEASDVATAIYDGADAVMLSAETAAGDYPSEAVAVMGRIIIETESDLIARGVGKHYPLVEESTDADAIADAACEVAISRGCSAIVAFSSTGSTVLRAARIRCDVPVLGLTPFDRVARKLSLVWGVYSVQTKDITSFSEMVGKAVRIVQRKGFAVLGDRIVITAGIPFGTPGTTNVLRLTEVSSKYNK